MSDDRPRLPPLGRSLSARLLILTIVFVMLAEVLIYAPSIGRFRLDYLEDRIAAGHLAILALLATPDYMVDAALERELLDHARAYVIGLKRPDGIKLMLGEGAVPPIAAQFDLREQSFLGLIAEAFATLAQRENRVLRVVGPSPRHPQTIVEIVFDEAPMRMSMIDFSNRILALSVGISLFAAALVFLSLQWLIVRPIRRMTLHMTEFRDHPEDASRPMPPTRRSDEIGVAQRELARMQEALRAALHQKAHLAALGTAVAKINHDLRNTLAVARLASDRLARVGDASIKGTTPQLLAAIDRAVDLATAVLGFTGEGPPAIERRPFGLAELIDDVGAQITARQPAAGEWINDVDPALIVEADRDQLYRVVANLGQNAYQAGATRVTVAARADGGRLVVAIGDNGPGLPPRAREKLFQPFAGSARAGGTGLGLAIAREIAQSHGGDLVLVESAASGTVFEFHLPRTLPAKPVARGSDAG